MNTSDSDLKVNRNIYPHAVTWDRMRHIGPKSGQLEPLGNYPPFSYSDKCRTKKASKYVKRVLPLFHAVIVKQCRTIPKNYAEYFKFTFLLGQRRLHWANGPVVSTILNPAYNDASKKICPRPIVYSRLPANNLLEMYETQGRNIHLVNKNYAPFEPGHFSTYKVVGTFPTSPFHFPPVEHVFPTT